MEMGKTGNSESSHSQNWMEVVSKYNFPDIKKSIWQLINSVVPFFGIWALMFYSLEFSYWISLALLIPAAGFMIRIFIIFHDCAHRSFFKSPTANIVVGYITGLFTLTGFVKWQRSHNKHHATVGNLDKRGVGDVITMTVDEYRAASKSRRLFYRLYRNPLLMFFIGAPYVFILQNRLFAKNTEWREKRNVLVTSFILAIITFGISLVIGFKAFIMIQLPVFYLSAIIGTWLFYMQHQFEGVHWYREGEWVYHEVALSGSSYYKLPRILQWFSGNIGFHHVHHLSPRIPNYKLEACHNENSLFDPIKPISIMESFRSMKLRLWDEESKQLVSFKMAKSRTRK